MLRFYDVPQDDEQLNVYAEDEQNVEGEASEE
jgi:hypothetical protein